MGNRCMQVLLQLESGGIGVDEAVKLLSQVRIRPERLHSESTRPRFDRSAEILPTSLPGGAGGCVTEMI